MYYLERAGEGPPVLCVHGFLQSSAFFAAMLERLGEAGRRAIAVDLPGFGASRDEPGPHTLEGLADAVAGLLDRLQVARVALLGASMGGAVAQHFALRHPKRLTRLLLVATGPYTGDPAKGLAMADALAAANWGEETVRPIVQGFFHRTPPPARMEELYRVAASADPQAAVAAARSNATARTLDRLHEIAVPTLIVQGRHDRARTVAHGEEMRERIPGARLEVLEHSGHTPYLEEPEAFHSLALPFLLQAGE
jgi:pimeloyl-ACP methyl ester carboxylesterase